MYSTINLKHGKVKNHLHFKHEMMSFQPKEIPIRLTLGAAWVWAK